MKWWYWLVAAVVVVGVTWWWGQARRTIKPGVIKQQPLNPGEIEVVDKVSLKPVVSKTYYGKVKWWEASTGVITLVIDGEEKNFTLDPATATIYVPVAGAKTKEVLVVGSREGPRWQTAFCAGDMASVAVAENGKITLADNSGYRQCGFTE